MHGGLGGGAKGGLGEGGAEGLGGEALDEEGGDDGEGRGGTGDVDARDDTVGEEAVDGIVGLGGVREGEAGLLPIGGDGGLRLTSGYAYETHIKSITTGLTGNITGTGGN